MMNFRPTERDYYLPSQHLWEGNNVSSPCPQEPRNYKGKKVPSYDTEGTGTAVHRWIALSKAFCPQRRLQQGSARGEDHDRLQCRKGHCRAFS